MNAGSGSTVLQAPSSKQQYYGGAIVNNRYAHQHHHHSMPISIHVPRNIGQTHNQNGHIRSVPSTSSTNPINMSIPITNTITITHNQQNHGQQQQQPQMQQMTTIQPNSNFRGQQGNVELQQQQQHQQSNASNVYEISNQSLITQSQSQFTQNSNNQLQTQHQMQQQQVNSSIQQEHNSIIVNLSNLLDIDIEERPHVCQVCQATYKTRTHLRRHMFIHLQNRPYPCAECSKGFNRKEHLHKHIEAVHSVTRYKCHLCGKDISRKDHLARHIKNMHNSDLNDPMVQAQLNPIQLPSSSENASGSSPHKKESQSSARANRLSQIEINENEDGIHFMIGELSPIDATKLSPEKVPKTQSNFTSSSQTSILDQLKYNSASSEFFQSSSTNISIANKKMLNQLYTCRECHATFPLEKDLNIHLRVHKAQPYKCNQCPRAYTRREKLTEHVRCFHQGQKFACEYCDKQLSRKDHVLRHVRSVHPEVLANRFVSKMDLAENGALNCAAGGSSGQRSANTSSQGNSSNIPSMGSMGDMGILLRSVCHVCLKVFGTSYHLQRHCESCHNGNNRPFACNFCKKQFKRKDHLTKHVKSHCPSMKDATKPPRGSGSRKSSKNAAKRAVDSELSTIDHETMNSLQIEMSTPDEDVEVAIAIVNTTNSESNTVNTSTNCSSSTTNLLNNLSTSSSKYSIIPPSTTSPGISITATTINPKLPNSSSTYTRNLQEIISSKYRPSSVIARKSSVGSSAKNNENKLATTLAMATRTTADFTCGHCQLKFPTKEKMIQHLQSHPSTSSSSPISAIQQPVIVSQNSVIASTAHETLASSIQSMSVVEVIEMISSASSNNNSGNSTKSVLSNTLLWN